MKQIAIAAASMLMLMGGAALADETWTTTIGDVIYESEVDGTAIFTYPIPGGSGEVGRLYFPGLAGNYDNRGTHPGYWIGPGEGSACDAALTGVDGHTSKDWGQLLLMFHNTGYPTGFTLVNGSCFGPLVDSMVAQPKTE